MKVWLSLPFLPVPRLVELAAVAEGLGVHGVALPEHVCVPVQVESDYPYTGRRAVLPVETELPDPIVLATGLGASTTRLRFMTHVLLVPLRHPVLLAKDVATAAALTGGRLDLGVGVGWLREEFDALGIPFRRRGSRMDEALPLLRRLWTGEPVGHQGEHFAFEPVAVRPVPPAPVPLLVGGQSEAALRRAARLGDGWVGVNPTIDELSHLLQQLGDERRAAGREAEPFEVRTGVKGRLDVDVIGRLRRLRVDGLIVTPWQLLPRATAPDDVPDEVLAKGISTVVAQVLT